MPVSRGKRIIDTRPQAVETGVGSMPLHSADESATSQRAGRRVASSGVESIHSVALAEGETSTSTAGAAPQMDASMSSVPPQPARFTLPAALLQRMQQQQHQPPPQAHHSPPPAVDVSPAVPTPAVTADSISTLQSAAKEPKQPQPQPQHHEPPQRTPAVAMETSGPDSVGVEEVSAAQVTATVAARKTTRVHHHDAPDGVPSDSTAPTTTTTTAVPAKPVIFSQRWRRQLFSSNGGLHVPLPPAQTKESGVGGAEAETVTAVEEVSGDDADPFASPFGSASIIKFGKVKKGASPANSGVSSAEEDDEDDGDGVAEGSLDGAAMNRPSRRQRHEQREQDLAMREKKRVRRHMSGFDEAYLQEQEARLLGRQPAAKEEEEEEEESGDSDEESESFSSASGDASSNSGEEDEEGDREEEEEEGNEEVNAQGAPVVVNGGGFGAVSRARQQRAEEHRAREAGSDMSTAAAAGASSSSAGTTPTSPSPLAGPNAAVGARSHWLDTFFFAVHENRLKGGGCHHTLLGLRGAVAIRGPCGLIGFGLGEVCVNGFYLGKKQVNLWHEEHHAVLTPMRKLKTKHAQDMELPQWPNVADPVWPPPLAGGGGAATSPTSPSVRTEGEKGGWSGAVLGRPLNPAHFTGTSPSRLDAPAPDVEESEEDFLTALQWDCEAVFGEIDWAWVETTVQSWRGLFANKLPPILLVIQPSSSVRRPRRAIGPMRKFYLASKRSRRAPKDEYGNKKRVDSKNTPGVMPRAYMDIPAFVAHRKETSVDLALLPTIVPGIAAQGCGCVMVLGSANIGKSTLCRFLANVLLSQHGLCYWLDLDVGQPEFGVPGQLSLVQVRRPLMRDRDSRCVRTVASLFVGANTVVQCPVTAANALAAICALAAAVAREHPVVVNTHGWVLQTGRRVSVEALRRLRPRQVIHLYKEREEAWAQDTAALLDPRNGLNAEVVQRRFLVPRPGDVRGEGRTTSSPKGQSSRPTTSAAPAGLLGRLPFPDAFDTATSGASSPSSPSSPTVSSKASNARRGGANTTPTTASPAPSWKGQVHAVRVEREETYSSVQQLKETKGSRGRQQRWQVYFAPLLHFYAQRNTAANGGVGAAGAAAAEAETTLLSAPLSSLHGIVMAERDEKASEVALFPAASSASSASAARQAHVEVAAALEHAVVAVLFHAPPSQQQQQQRPCGSAASSSSVVVRSLASLPCGFPVTCYGVVESSEEELLTGTGAGVAAGDGAGWIQVRVPLRPAVVSAMLQASSGATVGTTCISIAYSVALRQDTAFVDV